MASPGGGPASWSAGLGTEVGTEVDIGNTSYYINVLGEPKYRYGFMSRCPFEETVGLLVDILRPLCFDLGHCSGMTFFFWGATIPRVVCCPLSLIGAVAQFVF